MITLRTVLPKYTWLSIFDGMPDKQLNIEIKEEKILKALWTPYLSDKNGILGTVNYSSGFHIIFRCMEKHNIDFTEYKIID